MDIDFVIPWVDGSDLEWRKNKNKYSGKIDEPVDITDARYRDWDILKYWFRGVEKYAPWVHKIYFVTCGQKPDWLNENHDKLVLVNHEDYIPHEYLPTFSSHTIELNFHRIKNLSEHFVYFNDDVFITSKVEPEDFFKNGLPRDNYKEVNMDFSNEDKVFTCIVKNNYKTIGKHYNKLKTILSSPAKYINIRYGIKKNLQTIKNTVMYKEFVGINNNHIAQPYLKSYFNKVWNEEKKLMESTSNNKFRNKDDVNVWLIRYFQLMDKNFIPRNFKLGKFFCISQNNENIISTIKNKKYKMICINDSDKNIDFEKCKLEINTALEKKLPKKCSFEK